MKTTKNFLNKQFLNISFAIACAHFPCFFAYASDGNEGPTSNGTEEISLEIPNLVRISNIADIDFGTYNGIGSPTLNDDVCIYTNFNSGQYIVKARGSGASFAFSVNDGGVHSIPYAVRWNDSVGTGGNIALSPDVASPTQSGADTQSQTCTSGDNANFQVTFDQNDLLNAPPGAYSGVLTLVIEPA